MNHTRHSTYWNCAYSPLILKLFVSHFICDHGGLLCWKIKKRNELCSGWIICLRIKKRNELCSGWIIVLEKQEEKWIMLRLDYCAGESRREMNYVQVGLLCWRSKKRNESCSGWIVVLKNQEEKWIMFRLDYCARQFMFL